MGPRGGELTLESDGLKVDDRYYFLTHPTKLFSVLVVNGAPSFTPVEDETFYFTPVLDSLGRQKIRYKIITMDELLTEDLGPWDVVVLMNAQPREEKVMARLKSHLSRGGGLWVTAGDNLKTPGPLSFLLPGRLLAPWEPEESLRLAAGNETHVLGRTLEKEDGFEWGKVMVHRAIRVKASEEARVLLITQKTREPILLVGRVSGGTVALLTTTLDRDWSNLPSKPVFPVLCQTILAHLAGAAVSRESTSLLVDDPFRGMTEIVAVGSVKIMRPDGTKDDVSFQHQQWLYEKTDQPGLYTLVDHRSSKPLGVFAVNLDSSSGEGDLTRVSKELWSGVLPAKNAVWVPHTAPVLESFQDRVRGKDMTGFLAAAVLLFFSFESILSGVTLKKR